MPSIPITDIANNPDIYFDNAIFNLASNISPTSRKDVFDLADRLADLRTKQTPFRFREKDVIIKRMQQRDTAIEESGHAGEEVEADSDPDELHLATDEDQVELRIALGAISAQAAPQGLSATSAGHEPAPDPEVSQAKTQGGESKPAADEIPTTVGGDEVTKKATLSTGKGGPRKRKCGTGTEDNITPSTDTVKSLRRSRRDHGGAASGTLSDHLKAQALPEHEPRPRKKRRTWCWQRPDGTLTDTEPIDSGEPEGGPNVTA